MKQFLARHSPLVILALLCIILGVIEPNFRQPLNLQQVAYRTAVVGIIAVGQTLVIISGGIDLSVGSVAALSGVVGALTMTAGGMPMPVGVAVGSLVGMLIGLANGLLWTKGGIPPFIVTLGTMMAARGASLLAAEGKPVYHLPDSFAYLGGSRGWWIPVAITIAITTFFAVLLIFSRYGRALFATGGNPTGARLSGIAVDRVRTLAFVFNGLLTGFAGMMLASRTSIADPMAAEGMELDAIAATVIGGASLMGGEGGVFGSLAGALIMNVLVNFFNLRIEEATGVYWQSVFIGGLIIVLVFYDNMRKRRAGLLKD
jgi:ribose transport system permease protein